MPHGAPMQKARPCMAAKSMHAACVNNHLACMQDVSVPEDQYLAQISHLTDVLDLVLSCAGGDDHLAAPLAQVADHVGADESIAPEHGGSDTARLRAKDVAEGV